jgi:hypothetical protein
MVRYRGLSKGWFDLVPSVRIWDCGFLGKVPHVRIGMVDELERCPNCGTICG